VIQLLRDQGVGDKIVFGGGIFPQGDIPKLKQAGIAEIFTPGTPLQTIVDFVLDRVPEGEG
jgi:methylmalonyl-CoA mutase C-terminal domain/subunit